MTKSLRLAMLLLGILLSWCIVFPIWSTPDLPENGSFDSYDIVYGTLSSQIITNFSLSIVVVLYVFTMIMFFSRPYIIRMLTQFSLRFTVDIWWVAYLVIRDVSLYVCFTMGLIVMVPFIYIGYQDLSRWPLLITQILLLGVIALRLFRDTENNPLYAWITYGALIVGFPFLCYSYYDLLIQGSL